MDDLYNIKTHYENKLLETLGNSNCYHSLSSPSRKFDIKTFQFSTIFSNAIIMLCLLESGSIQSIDLINAIDAFLKNEKSSKISFNYWSKTTSQYSDIPYPDDLDDTFCALAALVGFMPDSLTGKELKRITELLIHQEVELGGPYFTWIVNEDDIEWKDIDLAVNSNIAFFLKRFDIELNGIIEFTEKRILERNLTSKYYPQSTPVAYFVSKWYRGKEVENLVKILEEMYFSENSTILDKVIISTSLLRLGQLNHPLLLSTLDYLQKYPEHLNNAYVFYRGVNPTSEKIKYYSGSRGLSLAFGVELISLYLKSQPSISKPTNRNKLHLINKRIIKSVKNKLKQAGGAISIYGIKRLNVLQQNPDMQMITCIPYITQISLSNNSGSNSKVIENLCEATLLGWLAYDIYDDFYDNQGLSHDLSVANYCLRLLTGIFTSDYLPVEFHDYFYSTMDIVDNANSAESLIRKVKIHSNKINISKNLIDSANNIPVPHTKSIGHLLGVIAVYSINNKSLNSRLVKNAIQFFENYLDARQIIDDMHDWEEDLLLGKINSVSREILIFANARDYRELSIEEMRKIFWENVVVRICKEVMNKLNKAKKTDSAFTQILEPLREAIELTLKEQKKAVDFIS